MKNSALPHENPANADSSNVAAPFSSVRRRFARYRDGRSARRHRVARSGSRFRSFNHAYLSPSQLRRCLRCRCFSLKQPLVGEALDSCPSTSQLSPRRSIVRHANTPRAHCSSRNAKRSGAIFPGPPYPRPPESCVPGSSIWASSLATASRFSPTIRHNGSSSIRRRSDWVRSPPHCSPPAAPRSIVTCSTIRARASSPPTATTW